MIRIVLTMICVVLAWFAESAYSVEPDAQIAKKRAVASALQPGMRVASARQLLGRDADSTNLTGACGVMEVLTWRDEQIRLVTTGGVVAAVVATGSPKTAK